MAGTKPKNPDELTILVFKDNQASRTFRLPLAWISRLGFALAVGLGVLAGALILSVRLYRSTLIAEPTRVKELEAQLAEYKGQVQQMEQAPEYAPPAEGRLTLKPSDIAEPYAPFRALPEGVKLAQGEAAQSVEIRNIEVSIKEPKVALKFWLLNTRRSGGTQQGRIVILARGPDFLLTYPKGVLNGAGAPSLIDPQQGEFFSITKFRETSAEFELRPDRKKESLREFEVYILGKGDEIIMVKRIPFSLPGAEGATRSEPPPMMQTPPPAEPSPPPAPKPVAKPVTPPPAAVVPPTAAPTEMPPTSTPPSTPTGDPNGGT
ncbi:MAG TPA: hypothetical protein VL588_03755 [Bdellovibrionota bacterium]|nr:hypothetical protein [Bdellovibrionota bacterium]